MHHSEPGLFLPRCWSWKSLSLLVLYTACLAYEDGERREETSEEVQLHKRLGCSSMNQPFLYFLYTILLFTEYKHLQLCLK